MTEPTQMTERKTQPIPVSLFRAPSSGGNSGIQIIDRQGFSLVHVFAKIGETAAVCKKLKIGDTPGTASIAKDYVALPLSPGQWLLASATVDYNQFCTKISKKLSGIGYASEQSNSRACIRVSGPRIVEFMERCTRLDLHPTKVETGYCAQTQMAQIGIVLHRVADDPAYDLYVYSGFAEDFMEWLIHTAEKYGVSVSAESVS